MSIKKYNEMYMGKRVEILSSNHYCFGMSGVIIRGYAPEHLVTIQLDNDECVNIGCIDDLGQLN